MANVSVLVLRAPGINCDEETAFAWEQAGARAERLHIRRVIETPDLLSAYQILTVPGGFSYGDDIASGRILGNQLAIFLKDQLANFVDRGGLILGICNGFQVLVRAGLLPGPDCPITATLTWNESGRYEDRWVRLRAEDNACAFLEPGAAFVMPVAHGEGRLVIEGGEANLPRFEAAGCIALKYVSADGSVPQFPENPNGSIGNAAGLVDRTGRVLGLMPHPERAIAASSIPAHLRDGNADKGGLRIFQRAVSHFR